MCRLTSWTLLSISGSMRRGTLFGWGGIKPLCFVTVRGDDADLVEVVSCQVGIDEDQEVGDG